MNDFTFICALALKSSTAVLLAAQGEVLCERAGIINLGIEGMMLLGALTGFAAGLATGSAVLAFACAGAAGALLAGVHAFFCLRLGTNQLLSGIALAILGAGLANFLGRSLIGKTGIRLADLPLPVLSDLPVLGPALFRQNAAVYAALLVTAGAWFLLERTRPGLCLKACGENPEAADAMGVNVTRTRLLAVLAGGFLAGTAGASLSVAYTPGWKEGMTGGQGWIAVAVVLFSGWRPVAALAGALLFGLLNAAGFLFQALGVEIVPLYVLKMLPYMLTILTLTLTQAFGRRSRAPAGLGKPFFRERA